MFCGHLLVTEVKDDLLMADSSFSYLIVGAERDPEEITGGAKGVWHLLEDKLHNCEPWSPDTLSDGVGGEWGCDGHAPRKQR